MLYLKSLSNKIIIVFHVMLLDRSIIRVASDLKKSVKLHIFSRSGNCQGILKFDQWKMKGMKSQGEDREKLFWSQKNLSFYILNDEIWVKSEGAPLKKLSLASLARIKIFDFCFLIEMAANNHVYFKYMQVLLFHNTWWNVTFMSLQTCV